MTDIIDLLYLLRSTSDEVCVCYKKNDWHSGMRSLRVKHIHLHNEGKKAPQPALRSDKTLLHGLPTLTNGKHEQGVKKVKAWYLRCLSELGFPVQQSEETLGVSSQCSLQSTLWGITASDKFAYGCVLCWCKQLALHFLQCVRQSGAWTKLNWLVAAKMRLNLHVSSRLLLTAWLELYVARFDPT